jgi:hypothetical protein
MNTIPPDGDAPVDRRRRQFLPADQIGLELIGRLRSVAAERHSLASIPTWNDRSSKEHLDPEAEFHAPRSR